jgi:hypothetical protein
VFLILTNKYYRLLTSRKNKEKYLICGRKGKETGKKEQGKRENGK